MPVFVPNPDHLFDRTWRPGRPLRPRLRRLRRWGMLAFLAAMCGLIGGYWYLTEPHRVRRMAVAYLTDLLGCRVEIGDAKLTLFEGLRLDRVTIRTGAGNQADSSLFDASTLLIRYDPRDLVFGRIRATQIVAVNPAVHISENLDTHQWNYQVLTDRSAARAALPPLTMPQELPEVVLRNGTIIYAEINHSTVIPKGAMAIEGQFSPTDTPATYAFGFQSRGAEGLGPDARGEFNAATGRLTATLANFTFGPDIKAMLSSEVRQFCQAHEIQGRVEIPHLAYTPPTGPAPARFSVEMAMSNVTMSVSPQEWLGPDASQPPQSPDDLARLTGITPPADVAADGKPQPIRLSQVSGTLLFSDDRGIQIRNLIGRVEGNAVAVDGVIGGYSPDAPMDLVISNPATENFFVPASPRYVVWLPPAIQNIYKMLRPQGTCDARVRVQRVDPAKPLIVSGELNVLQGQFVFDQFPYPVQNASGRILLDKDPGSGLDRVVIDNVRGNGIKGGPNADTVVNIAGAVSPLDDHAGASIRVWSDRMSDEPALRDAMAPEFRRAFSMFHPLGDGPMFAGAFNCSINCPPGGNQVWTVVTSVTLTDGNASFSGFPYPLQHVRGTATFSGNHADIDGHVQHGDALLAISGRVDWDAPPGSSDPAASAPIGVRPDLYIVGRDVPIDHDLLNTLPPSATQLAGQIGLTGRVDVDSHVFAGKSAAATQPAVAASAAATTQPDIAYDVKISLHDAAMRADGGEPLMDSVAAQLRATTQVVTITDFQAKRGQAHITGAGTAGFGGATPQFDIRAQAVNLDLDHDLYLRLPAAAQSAWDQVQPVGTVDVDLSCAQVHGNPAASGAGPLNNFVVLIHPRKLSVTPAAVPLRLDDVQGSIALAGSQVTLEKVTARHGDSHIAISGAGSTLALGPWDVRLSASDLTLDDSLLKAMPSDLTALVRSLSLEGKINVDFSKLTYRPAAAAGAATASQPAGATKPASQPMNGPDIDFAVHIGADGLSGDVGVPLTHAKGAFDLSGKIRRGQLNELAGNINADALTVGGKSATAVRAAIAKPADSSSIQVSHIQGTYCDGDLGGDVSIFYPDSGPSRYSMNFALRNADVAQLAPGADKDIKGRLTASLTLEGTSGQPATRRGRGDVAVSGKDMYHIPLLLSLLQITNLSLPINSPFESATARYSVQGQRVAIEDIALRGNSMTMQGSGSLDFDTRKVSLTFVTNNPNWPTLPVVGPLLQSARNEMLQIHVDGTIQSPRVSATSLDSVTTTVDQVFTGAPR